MSNQDIYPIYPRRRRGLDDAPFQIERRRPPRSIAVVRLAGPETNTMPSSGSEEAPSVEATVKWFKDDRGYGFVEIGTGQSDAFLHASTLHAAGVGTVSAGAKLRVVVRHGLKGPQVARVVQVDSSEIVERPYRSSANHARPARRPQPDPATAVSLGGKVKWFNEGKRFGFVVADDGNDVFVHASTLEAAGVAHLADGQAVMMRVVDTPRGREAIAIAV